MNTRGQAHSMFRELYLLAGVVIISVVGLSFMGFVMKMPYSQLVDLGAVLLIIVIAALIINPIARVEDDNDG